MSADANVFRWAIRRFFSKTELDAGALDARYFAESEFINTSAGAGDAGKPIKLDSGGLINSNMLPGGSLATHAALTAAHGATGAVVGTTNTQTLTNKTLTSPNFGLSDWYLSVSGGVNPLVNFDANDFVQYDRSGNSLQVYIGGSAITQTAASGLAVTGALTVGGVNVVTTTGSQTLTNKTLTAPVISTISNTGTLTLPTSTDTLVGRATTDTLTNKTLTTPTISSTGFTNAQHAHTGASSGGQLDHGAALTGLTDDDHTQYALLAGRSGGSTLYGGTAANEDLTLHGTSNATRTSSYVLLQPTAGNVVIGGTTSAWKFEVAEGNYRVTVNPGFSGANYISSYNDVAPGLNTAPLYIAASTFATVGDSIGIQVSKTPTSSADASGNTGDICWSSTHIYVKTGAGAWKRAALSTF